MIAKVDGSHTIKIVKSDGSTQSYIRCKGPVLSAYVNGGEVNVQLCDGSAAIYKIDGTPIRYIHR